MCFVCVSAGPDAAFGSGGACKNTNETLDQDIPSTNETPIRGQNLQNGQTSPNLCPYQEFPLVARVLGFCGSAAEIKASGDLGDIKIQYIWVLAFDD